ncbi:MAG: rod shape-determining protein MreD [Candidatus Sericytochromatia bacterium]|uniref:Rod shape-determining protein MreD n=1 Tax=Candidatus Tanganyikabacteria bacterium TaxID=2961651 RepID=A0A937X6G8_9BACT|nr:rod shape-determining protein MreD [Candidatus Tanganyikabacteria bacterium]
MAIPLLATIVAVVLNVVPLRLPDYAPLAPGFVLMAVFYWTVHRPDLMRPWAVFLIGVLDDMLSGTPLGVNSLVLLFVHWAIVAQHRVFRGKSFLLIWLGFALVALGAKMLLAAVAFLIGYGLLDPLVLLVQYFLTLALYPPLALIMGRAQRVFLPAR